MSDRDDPRRRRPPGDDFVEVRDTGDSLESALAQEETAALAAASEAPKAPSRSEMEADVASYAMQPLFIPGVSDTI